MAPSRREFLQVASGLGLSLGPLTRYGQKLVPYLVPPEDLVPGEATWYASSCRECPGGCGLILRNREGRVVKAEGNPNHPINRGKLCARGQASLQGLYNPDRLRYPLQKSAHGRAVSVEWETAWAAVAELLRPRLNSGRVAVITDLMTGSDRSLLHQWLGLFGAGPERHLTFEPLNYGAVKLANRTLFGYDGVPGFSVAGCDFVLSLGSADFLETWHSPVRMSGELAAQREPFQGMMVRTVHVGPRLSLTAANADERITVRPGHEHALAMSMLQVIVANGQARQDAAALGSLATGFDPETIGPQIGVEPRAIRELATAFASSRQPVALGGPAAGESPEAVATASAAALLNHALATPAVDFRRRQGLSDAASAAELDAFTQRVGAGNDVVLIIGANPLYALPAEHPLHQALTSGALGKVVALTPKLDETAAVADWVLPVSHPLEAWGDAQPEAGVFNLLQPVMGPVFGTEGAPDLLLRLAARCGVTTADVFGANEFYEYLRQRWVALQKLSGVAEYEVFWTEAVRRGGWFAPLPAPMVAALRPPAGYRVPAPAAGNDFRLVVFPSNSLYDGRGADKPWLQELPDPITHAVWNSWVEVGEQDAARLKVAQGDLLKVTVGNQSFVAPAAVLPHMAPGTLAVPMGQGHTAFGRYANGPRGERQGVNVLPLVAFGAPVVPATPIRTGEQRGLLTTDGVVQPEQEGREVVQLISLDQVATAKPGHIDYPLPEGYTADKDLYPPHQHEQGHRWGMVIDLNRCTGCSACVTACYAENNLPVVGPEKVSFGRQMSWLRIDRYFEPHSATPVLFEPMLCQHCDQAPCEPVCPVFAAYHTKEGLNGQVYNRCIGTRYCANNCPWKVRYFNWFDPEWPEPLNWQLNPDVTVRSRGVMEKCTFCVQRIHDARRRAKLEDRAVRDGDVVTACAQACPSDAIVFGDLMDPNSRVARLIENNRRFQVLGELNTKTAVIYLKRVQR